MERHRVLPQTAPRTVPANLRSNPTAPSYVRAPAHCTGQTVFVDRRGNGVRVIRYGSKKRKL